MDALDRRVIIGIGIAAALTASLYAFLASSDEEKAGGAGGTMDSDTIQECRSLLRESADILVQVARDGLGYEDPDDAARLSELEARVSEIEAEMEGAGCNEDREQWVYGSFIQEMSEYESYIAELVRQNDVGT